MDGAELLHNLQAVGLTLVADGDNLRVTPRENLTDELRTTIRENKWALLAERGVVAVWQYRRITIANGEEWIVGERLDKPGWKSWPVKKQ